MEQPHIVIIGGGFGGLYAANALKNAEAKLTLIDRRNYHLFQPLLYQVATGGLSPANIATPLRSLLQKHRNTQVILAEVTGFDCENRQVILKDGAMSYDYLIVAAGAMNNYFGHEPWEKFAPSLKTIEEATEIRRRMLLAFEAAERESDPAKQKQLLTFIVIGGGPTGVELAGALAEVAYWTLGKDFRNVDPKIAEIILLEAGPRILAPYPEDLSAKATQALHELGVKVRVNSMVQDIQAHQLTVQCDGEVETIFSQVVLWGAGVKASPLGQALAKATGVELDRGGRVHVDAQLRISGYPDVFVIGDLAHCVDEKGKSLPGVAPVAMQQGRYVARLIQRESRGRPMGPFQYHDKGSMATIGRARAVVDLGWLHLSGFLAWLTWLFVHLMYLVAFENRLLVLMQWGWNYFTRNRSARLITKTGEPHGNNFTILL